GGATCSFVLLPDGPVEHGALLASHGASAVGLERCPVRGNRCHGRMVQQPQDSWFDRSRQFFVRLRCSERDNLARATAANNFARQIGFMKNGQQWTTREDARIHFGSTVTGIVRANNQYSITGLEQSQPFEIRNSFGLFVDQVSDTAFLSYWFN